MSMQAVTVVTRATASTQKLRAPLISSKSTTPQIAPTKPGPEVIIGNETAKLSAPLATNQEMWPAAQITPDASAGRMIRVSTLGCAPRSWRRAV